jgi:hypothetical protein
MKKGKSRDVRGRLAAGHLLSAHQGRGHFVAAAHPILQEISQAIYLVARPKIRDIGYRLLYRLMARVPACLASAGAIGVLIRSIPTQFCWRDAGGADLD